MPAIARIGSGFRLLQVLRHIFAYLSACYVGGLVILLGFVLLDLLTGGSGEILRGLSTILVFIGMSVIMIAPVLLPFTLVALFVIKRSQNGSKTAFATAGAIVGAAGIVVWGLLNGGWQGGSAVPVMAFTGSLPGAIAGLVYRWLAPAMQEEAEIA